MATLIKETPVLTGKNAVRFEKMIKRNTKRKISTEDVQRGKNAYELFGFANKDD